MHDKNSYWDDKRPKEEDFATKDDLDKLDRKIDKLIEQEEKMHRGSGSNLDTAKKVVGGVARGLGDIAKSLSTPNTSRRMKIGQMPERKAPIARTRPQNPIAGRNAGIKKHRISDAPID